MSTSKGKQGGRRKNSKSAPAVHAVILAGGAGERFWPRSRRATPKPLMEIVGGKTLLAATLERARQVADKGKVWLVCGHEHARAMKSASGLSPSRVLVEPEPLSKPAFTSQETPLTSPDVPEVRVPYAFTLSV